MVGVRILLILPLIISYCYGDIYLHNPRGSNNRLDEEGRERNNGNRLFDSQNNDRGGYNVGGLYYYEGSILPVEWTNQHSCGHSNARCELIVQYMCNDKVRDGATTTTIPENMAQCAGYDCNNDMRYGMHENFEYYTRCKLRERNKGLFLADQKPKGDTAKFTRQNPDGTRRGFECAEERDYYPYWHPSPWRDIAIMTNDVSRCKLYTANSQNVKERWECVVPYALMMQNVNTKLFVVPNTEEDCKAFRWPLNNQNGTRAEWTRFDSHGIPAPKCQEAQFSRDNHLGNGIGGVPNQFNWTIPVEAVGERCVLRMRYNVSTDEIDAWNGATNASLNEKKNGEGSLIDLSSKYGLSSIQAAVQRGYILKNNPQVQIFNSTNFKLQLAINTAQYGRTFQDRSHVMAIRQRPPELSNVRIMNLNVRGKRGNIVQVYPAVEYDFVPNNLLLSTGDYVHIQWTGSNSNPQNNDGQGRAGTDRSNIVLLDAAVYAENSGVLWNNASKYGHFGRNFPAHLDSSPFLGLARADRENLAILTPGQFGGEMSELDDAGTYFDLGPKKVTQPGVSHYQCTRNNNFSNRDQKGRIDVNPNPAVQALIGYTGGSIELPGRRLVLTADEGTFSDLTHLQLEEWSQEDGAKKIQARGQSLQIGSGYASAFMVINPQSTLAESGRPVLVEMKLEQGAGSDVKVYHSYESHLSSWQEMDIQIEAEVARFKASEGGVYVARTQTNGGMVAGIVCACVAALIVIVGTIVYFRRKPEKVEACGRRLRLLQRSTQNQF